MKSSCSSETSAFNILQDVIFLKNFVGYFFNKGETYIRQESMLRDYITCTSKLCKHFYMNESFFFACCIKLALLEL
jgi:hypothetical protein